MLVLSRQRDEIVMIVTHDGELIEVTIVDIRGDKVRLGINAPTKIAVHRKEVYDAIKAEERLAAERSEAEERQAAKSAPPTRPVQRPASTPPPGAAPPSRGRAPKGEGSPERKTPERKTGSGAAKSTRRSPVDPPKRPKRPKRGS